LLLGSALGMTHMLSKYQKAGVLTLIYSNQELGFPHQSKHYLLAATFASQVVARLSIANGGGVLYTRRKGVDVRRRLL